MTNQLLSAKNQNSNLVDISTAQWEIQIEKISQLQEGWFDSYGDPIFPKAIAIIRKILQIVNYSNPEVGAVSDGSLDLNWPDKGIYCTFGMESAYFNYHPENEELIFHYDDEDTQKIANKFIEFVQLFIINKNIQ